MTLDLNSGERIWKPVCVRRPNGDSNSNTLKGDSVLTVKKLLDMDEIEFQSHKIDDTPGVNLRKGSLKVWTPIACIGLARG